MLLRSYIANVARLFLGAPYRWGGEEAFSGGGQPEGYDCSGFVVDVLQAFELLPARGDWSANQLAARFAPTLAPEPADLVVYGREDAPITHIGFYLGGEEAISAAGGGPGMDTVEEARARDARVKLHPVGYRSDLRGYRNIFAPLAGLEANP